MDEKTADFYKNVGEAIRAARIERKMSQAELAERAKVSLPQISNLEHGKTKMLLATFTRIAEALEVSADYLLRINSPRAKVLYQNELNELVSDCTPSEIEAIIKIVKEVKSTMRLNTQQINED